MDYRNLTQHEIDQLIDQHCKAQDWSNVLVKSNFTPNYIYGVRFSGNIRLGVFEKEFTVEGGVPKHSGIRHASLHNCIINDNVYIRRVQRYIANYEIGENSYIENTEFIATTTKSSFGNGHCISVLNETGGREIQICDKLSSHLAYILTLYRHRNNTIDKIKNIINHYSESVSSEMGYIGKNVTIISVNSIKNVKIGDSTNINGANLLENGSINSCELAPVYIGQGVTAKNFIISSGSTITDSSLIENAFIGQSVEIGKQFSIYDSAYFCNSQGFHGEACAIFGGPFTVTHHKSSLLIAGMYSFLNAGSGSNQSNHMYKLGPIHQGIVERGSKTTSDSYVLWPAKVGAFSLIMGRHTKHSDTSDLPFSYLIENKNQTYVVPGVNLRSVGTIRDAQKWPKRDKRKDPNKLDQINFNLLSPYTIQKMYNGIDILKTLQKTSGESSDNYSYQSAIITNRALKKGITFYEMAINKFLGNSIIKRLENTKFESIEQIIEQLKPDTQIGLGYWVDLSGLIAPKSEIDKLLGMIDNNEITTLDEIQDYFVTLHSNYYTYEWTWALQKIEEKLCKPYTQITIKDIINIVKVWSKSVTDIDNMLYEDAQKEFNLISQIGFGVDGEEVDKANDFANVRGTFNDNPFVTAVLEHIKTKQALGNELITRIEPLDA